MDLLKFIFCCKRNKFDIVINKKFERVIESNRVELNLKNYNKQKHFYENLRYSDDNSSNFKSTCFKDSNYNVSYYKQKRNFPIIDKESLKNLESAILYQNPNYKYEHLDIYHSSIVKLHNNKWLDSDIINAYLGLIIKNCPYEIHICNTFVYDILSQDFFNKNKVDKFFKGVNLSQTEQILIPVNLNKNHWSLVHVNTKDKKIYYYDSMQANSSVYNIFNTVSNIFYTLFDSNDRWQYHISDTPKQMNGYDCGVFMCKFIDYITRDETFDFSQNDMSYFRKLISVELLNGKLLSI